MSDTDLRKLYTASVERSGESPRTCPRCETSLETIRITLGAQFLVDRCLRCLGIFFDPAELETLMETAVHDAEAVDNLRISVLAEEGGQDDWPIAYLPCPVCGSMMNRRAYGARSGVVTDWCKHHGTWLDGGELGKLLTWARAGGVRKTTQVEERRRHEEALRKERIKAWEPRREEPREEPSSAWTVVDILSLLLP